MGVATYDPQKTQVILGAAPVSGFADGTFISIEQDDESFTLRKGADGEVARARQSARSATLTLTLMSTSTFNAILSAFHATDVIFPVLVKEGASIVAAGEAWIEMPAAFERGTDVGDAEWTIRIAKANFVHGGNP